MKLHLTVRDLRALLMPILPFAGTDDMLPVLTGIRLRVRGGYVTAEATDRFRAAMNRVQPSVVVHKDNPDDVKPWGRSTTPAPGETYSSGRTKEGKEIINRDVEDYRWAELPADLDVLIPAHQCRTLLSLFKAPRRLAAPSLEPIVTVLVEVPDLNDPRGYTKVTVSGSELLAGDAAISTTFRTLDGQMPDIGQLIAKELGAPASDRRPHVGLNPKFLASFGPACTVHGPNEPVSMMTGAPGKPLLGFVGDDFVGLIMPKRLLDGGQPRGDRRGLGRVPQALIGNIDLPLPDGCYSV